MRAFICTVDTTGKSEYHPSIGWFVPVRARNPTVKRFLVFDAAADAAPSGTFDLGDPSDPTWAETTLKQPELNFLSQQYPNEPDQPTPVVTLGPMSHTRQDLIDGLTTPAMFEPLWDKASTRGDVWNWALNGRLLPELGHHPTDGKPRFD